MTDKIKIVILAGGLGKRMKSDEPKALTLLQGKPFLKHILETVKSLDLDIKPVIVIGHKMERVKEVLGEDYTYALQERQLGTGHAVMAAKNVLGGGSETIIVLSADQPLVSKETIERILKTHEDKKPTITLGTVVVPDFLDWRIGLYTDFGRVVRDETGKVKKIVEFKDATPQEKEIKELNPALYAFDAKWLWENINNLKNENVQAEYLLTDLIKMAFGQHKTVLPVPIAKPIEGLQPNSKEELKALEKLLK